MEKYDKHEEEIRVLEAKLKPQLTQEWLDTLVEAARTCGWTVDHGETMHFVRWCCDVAGAEPPASLEPYQYP
ncbi:MAG TPA: hypothetical protein VI542_07400 [Candidatus Tectomicrobia bacterium]